MIRIAAKRHRVEPRVRSSCDDSGNTTRERRRRDKAKRLAQRVSAGLTFLINPSPSGATAFRLQVPELRRAQPARWERWPLGQRLVAQEVAV
ncbi:MAG: hypothetical protein JWO20_2445 [Candidatus Angelobacter sp.]|nr:hypothetical protein [Candidatus Angelobacter sp.]